MYTDKLIQEIPTKIKPSKGRKSRSPMFPHLPMSLSMLYRSPVFWESRVVIVETYLQLLPISSFALKIPLHDREFIAKRVSVNPRPDRPEDEGRRVVI